MQAKPSHIPTAVVGIQRIRVDSALTTAAGLRLGLVGNALKGSVGVHAGTTAASLVAARSLGTVAGLDTGRTLRAAAGLRLGLVGSALKGSTIAAAAGRFGELGLPRLDPELFSAKWDERVAAAIARLERAEEAIAAAPEPERAVEVLAADTDTVVGATPPDAREQVDRWIQWIWILLAEKLFLDPFLDPALDAAREAVLRVVIALVVIVMPPAPDVPPLPPSSMHVEPESPGAALTIPGKWAVEGVPKIVRRAGPKVVDRMIAFFTQEIRRPGTRPTYEAAATHFFAWCDERQLELEDISPVVVATYVEAMEGVYPAATIQQHLGAVRRVLDWLVIGQVVPLNPAARQ